MIQTNIVYDLFSIFVKPVCFVDTFDVYIQKSIYIHVCFYKWFQKFCEHYGASMLNVENSSENEFLRTFLPKLKGIHSFE